METERNKHENDNVLTIAASDSSDVDKARADYVCDGLNDQMKIREAVGILEKSGGGGIVSLFEGQYNCLDSEVLNKDDNVVIKGVCGKSAEISKDHTNGLHSYITSNRSIRSYHEI